MFLYLCFFLEFVNCNILERIHLKYQVIFFLEFDICNICKHHRLHLTLKKGFMKRSSMCPQILQLSNSRKKIICYFKWMRWNILQLANSRKKHIKNVCFIEKCSKYSNCIIFFLFFSIQSIFFWMEFPFCIGSVKVKQNKGTQRYQALTLSRHEGR